MKRIFFWIAASLGIVLYVFYSFSDPGVKIGRTFQKACQEALTAKELENSSYASAYRMYNNAITKLNNITGKYSSSEIALSLFNNKLKIGPYPFLEFKEEIIPNARLKAEAESNPLVCSFYAINLLDTIQYEDKLKQLKAVKLTEISTKFSKSWQFKKAKSVLAEGNLIVQTIYSDNFKISALTEMARVLGKAENNKEARQLINQAKAIIKNIPRSERRDAFIDIVNAYCALEEFESAEEFIIRSKLPFPDSAWSSIAKNYAEKGKLKTALKTAEKIKDDDLRDDAYQVIIGEYAASGKIEKAGELVGKINPLNIGCKVKTLADIAFYACINDKRTIAISYFEEAVRTANLIESHELPHKISILNYIAQRFIELGDNKNSIQLLESNSALAMKLSEFNRAEAFSEIAIAYNQIGESEKALQLITAYIPDYLTIDIYGDTLAKLAIQYAESQEYSKAIELSNRIEDDTALLVVNRASVLSQISIIAATEGDFQTALQIAKSINSPFYRPWTLGEIALQLPNSSFHPHKESKTKLFLHQIITELNLNKNDNTISLTMSQI